MRRRQLCWILALAPLAAAVAQEPEWLTKARSREAPLIDPVEIRSPDGALTARVPAKLAGPITKDDSEYVLQLDFGGDVPVNCEVLLDGFNLASTLRSASDITFKELESVQGKVEMSGVEGLDAGAYGPYPYLAAHWLYRAMAKDGPRVGGLKQVGVDMHSHGIYCAHIDLGYEQTFRAIVRSLAETLKLKDSPPLPKYLDISTAKLGDTPVGIAVSDVMVDEDGDTRTRTQMSLLLPAGTGSVNAVDSVQYQWTQSKGELINAGLMEFANGEAEADLKLLPGEDGLWHVTGTFQGKELNAVFGNKAPDTSLGQASKYRAIMAGKDAVGSETTTHDWTSLDPTRLTETKLKITGRRPDGTFTAQDSMGSMTMDLVMDPATGLPVSLTLPVGPQNIRIDRIYRQGSF